MKLIMNNFLIEGMKCHMIEFYDEEFIGRLRGKSLYGVPLSIVILSNVMCAGRCYEMSIVQTLGMDKFNLIRGNVNYYPLEDYPNHCWVEKDDWVYEPTNGMKVRKDIYYDLFEVEVLERYDEKTCVNDEIYMENIAKYKTESEKNLLLIELLLKTLKYLEKKHKTINGERLLKEINLYEQENIYKYNLKDSHIEDYINICFEVDDIIGYKLKREI